MTRSQSDYFRPDDSDTSPDETREWIESLDAVIAREGKERAAFLLETLLERARVTHTPSPALVQTPYVNTIAPEDEPAYPGNEAIELRIRRIVRWNAVAMVQRANTLFGGIGGHLATYASAATLYEVGFNHFFRGRGDEGEASGDQVFFQGHASPGIYARALLEGRLSVEQLERFRRECEAGRGLSSYPHPYLMPEFWEFPTVSMGLSPLAAIYQARFNRYLHHRGIKDTSASRVWAFLGDGETDEPEALGSLSIAAREKLDNLVFVVNCNLQRLDGPVRGNGKIIQELEAVFRGAGWNVIKVIWGRKWDALLEADKTGLLVKRMGEVVDGEYQKYSVEPGAYTREHFFGKYPELLTLVAGMTDREIQRLRRGGHDDHKVYAAFHAAVNHTGQPTVVLAKTVKGWTLGEAAQGKNVAHQRKKMSVEELKAFRDEIQLPIPDSKIADAPFYVPPRDSPEVEYVVERRRALGGFVPRRRVVAKAVEVPSIADFGAFLEGSGEAEVSTTNVFARLLAQMLADKRFGRRVVPIIPDEARTFGLDVLFRQYGIYSAVGQLYEPVDHGMLLRYREALDGQVLEEGITEAGATAMFTAAGTAYATHAEPMIPFYIFYSMFGYQRVGDQLWAFGDQRGRGFLCGATAGRTTLNGEGLQHQDGHSLLVASAHPTVRAYEPAFAYELAVIVADGLKRMYGDGVDTYYYLTLQNETYTMPPMPAGAADGIVRGLYKFCDAPAGAGEMRATLLGSGSILNEVLAAQKLLAKHFGVAAEVWSAPSYSMLRRDALRCERHNMLHPEAERLVPYVAAALAEAQGPIVAASDWVTAVPDQIARWVPGGLHTLGTDGFGRSDTRQSLRRFYGVDAETIAVATLFALAKREDIPMSRVTDAIRLLCLNPNAIDARS
ncbi:MAG: pyruvate dehydrogenase (acetyl-transferring), homodimeric type [Deltaproteobacteria bacterium]|nr:pyruvate dehydrogenase (acetyl-transferring), homodimeric type [Deltaproteobacteria bacterium]